MQLLHKLFHSICHAYIFHFFLAVASAAFPQKIRLEKSQHSHCFIHQGTPQPGHKKTCITEAPLSLNWTGWVGSYALVQFLQSAGPLLSCLRHFHVISDGLQDRLGSYLPTRPSLYPLPTRDFIQLITLALLLWNFFLVLEISAMHITQELYDVVNWDSRGSCCFHRRCSMEA